MVHTFSVSGEFSCITKEKKRFSGFEWNQNNERLIFIGPNGSYCDNTCSNTRVFVFLMKMFSLFYIWVFCKGCITWPVITTVATNHITSWCCSSWLGPDLLLDPWPDSIYVCMCVCVCQDSDRSGDVGVFDGRYCCLPGLLIRWTGRPAEWGGEG